MRRTRGAPRPHRVRGELFVLTVALALFAAIAADLLFQGPFTSSDAAVSAWFQANLHPSATVLMLAITHLHGTEGILAMTALLAAVVVARGHRSWLLPLLTIVPGGLLLNFVVKQGFERTRPVWERPLAHFSGSSFPSGHTNGAVVFWGFVALLAWTHGRSRAGRVAAVVSAAALALLAGLSRVYLGAHFPSDVAAGLAEGIAWLALGRLVFARRLAAPR